MGKFVKGDVVVVPFPFSDLSASKHRPAFVVTALTGDDIILCQITSRATGDTYAIHLGTNDFVEGNLNQESNIRPNRLFTADSKIIRYKAGALKQAKIREVIERIIQIING